MIVKAKDLKKNMIVIDDNKELIISKVTLKPDRYAIIRFKDYFENEYLKNKSYRKWVCSPEKLIEIKEG